ncbi:MAG: flagellar biosynthesis protein FlhF [Spirochaetaceae bacterium]|nr:MAG: flagellar biosynthesis protein FlhF [Spirochaetaceae bacterium]
MEIFIEQAGSRHEAEVKVRQKYGERARIMSHKTIRMGGFMGLFSREGVEVSGYFSNEAPRRDVNTPRKTPDLEEEKRKILAGAKVAAPETSTKTIELVLDEIRTLKQSLAGGNGRSEESGAGYAHPTLRKLANIMEANDFTSDYIQAMLTRVKNDYSLDALEDYRTVEERTLDWIGESISVMRFTEKHRPHVMVVVGPTGVGKTTTIAKLAAMYGVPQVATGAEKKVRILTIDSYRIGAIHQIQTYGKIMNIPVTCVETVDELQKQIALYDDADLVFVDTVGKSPRDGKNLGRMSDLLHGCGAGGDYHLALSATTKTSDMQQIAQQFEVFGYKSIILTKLDETTRVGNVISVLAERRKPLSFITDGQKVPENISPASVQKLLINLEGFTVNRDRIDEKFS